ncbi:hypothetical protein HMI56_005815, partial [Coelomomyces lativittatus]
SQNIVKSIQYYDTSESKNIDKILNPQLFNTPLSSSSIHLQKKNNNSITVPVHSLTKNFDMWNLLPALDLSMSMDAIFEHPQFRKFWEELKCFPEEFWATYLPLP